MLLSVERPFVGASALGRSGATLPHCNGLVQAVLPASDWNMCKRTIGVPQELVRSRHFLGNIPAGVTGWPTTGFGGAKCCLCKRFRRHSTSSRADKHSRVSGTVPSLQLFTLRKDGQLNTPSGAGKKYSGLLLLP